MKRVCSLLIAATIASSCTDDGRPRNAIETELSTTTVLGDFDVDYGQLLSTTVYVNVDGKIYELTADPDAVFSGFEGVSRMELNGRRAIVAGEVAGGVYRATYAELLPVLADNVIPEIQEMLAQRKVLEAELAELEAKYMSLMAEQRSLEAMIQAASEKPTDENEEKLTLLKEDFQMRKNAGGVLLTHIKAEIGAIESKIDLIDGEIAEASKSR